MTERWAAIPGYPKYFASSLGRVMSAKHCRSKTDIVMRQYVGSRGYMLCTLTSADGSSRPRSVHRLVLAAFAGPCPDGFEACHNNGVKTDNRVENLRWGTHAENTIDRTKHGTEQRGELHVRATMTENVARQIFAQRGFIRPRSLAETFGVTLNAVHLIHARRSWRCLHVDPASTRVIHGLGPEEMT